LLFTLTLVSTLSMIGALAYAWRLSRDAHERSSARVAALAADIDRTDAVEVTTGRLQVGVPTEGSAQGALFGTPADDAGTWHRLLPALLAGVVIVGGVVTTAVVMSDTPETTAAAVAPGPLELLSLRHATQNGMLTVTGLVRNPAGNRDVERLTAVVFLFDGKGGFLASGRSPLDFTRLGAGEESPFVVSLPAPAGVARYRVSFRQSEGGMLPHLDRREVAP
jgi:hypothetical protein